MTSMISPPDGRLGGLLRGSQTPRVSNVPAYVTSAGEEAIALAAKAGLHLDPWEAAVLTAALGERADGRWASSEVGVVVPRQNGKGSILEARELAGLFLFGEKLIIHSAHEQATSSEHFRRLLSLLEGVPDFDRRILKTPKGKGAEAIELRGGQRVLFKTRTGGGGRGLTGDLVVLDEAMILPEATIGALVPTMAARSIQGNPQLWYAGSAVDQTIHEHGLVLARVRDRGLRGSKRTAYFEWSAEGDNPDQALDKLHDPVAWAQANPGMGIRISEEHIAGEADGSLGPRTFAVERLGIGDWPDPEGNPDQVIATEAWLALADGSSQITSGLSVAFDVTPDRTRAAICAAGRRDDGLEHVEVIEHKAGTAWLVDALETLQTVQECGPIRYAKSSPAASLVPDLEARGVALEPLAETEHAQACGALFDAVEQKSVRHLGTVELQAAVRGAVKRPLGDAWAWSRKSSTVDISPLVAVTLALWGVTDDAGLVFGWGADGLQGA